MRRACWKLGVLVVLGLTACAKDAPLESEGVLGGSDVAEVSGTVTAVSRSQFIVRDAKGEEHALEIDDKTDFLREGRPVERVQLQEGTQVRTVYDVREGEWVAHKVELESGTAP